MGQPLPERLVFMGTPDFARASLRALLEAGLRPAAVFTQPDKAQGRGRKVAPPPVKVLAESEGLPVLQPASLKDPAAQEALRALEPDLIVVAAYGKILPKAVLEVPRFGCINVHASLLPRHRGASPVSHAIWEGDEVTGVSIMRMEEGLDTGPVYAQRAIPVPEGATTGTLTPVLAELGGRLLVEVLPGIVSGDLEPEAQDEAGATYAPRLRPEDGRLDFSQPARRLERQVRALSPWPGAFVTVRSERVKVERSLLGGSAPAEARPGEVVSGPPVSVACGDGRCLVLTDLQREGRRVLSSADLLRGFPVPPGTRLGE
ncbi:MAG: methionyl-tRNA formyltransferase [Acidobacteriota bacterium]